MSRQQSQLTCPLVRHLVKALGFLLVLALGASACGGSSSTGEAGSGSSTPDDIPGTEAFGLTEEEFTQHVEGVESSIAACMAEAGFEYIPLDVQTIHSVSDWLRTEPGVSRLDYKTEWGFAASTRFDDPAVEVSRGEQNIAIFDTLTEADQAAYERTLWGDDADATFGILLDDEGFDAAGGCTLTAVEEIFDADMIQDSFINPKDVLIEADPRVIAADEAWVGCMLDAGYDYGDQDEIIDEYEERLDALLDGDEPDELDAAKTDALAALQREEIEAALVDYKCQSDHVDDVIREVEIEVFGFAVSN